MTESNDRDGDVDPTVGAAAPLPQGGSPVPQDPAVTADHAPGLAGDGSRGGSRVLGGASDLERPGDEIGPYKLISQIGEGGFGTVWLAERRTPFVQRVALKVIKPGMDSKAVVARFEQERQALAVMSHPGIAKVLDGGLTPKGRPYFAMEHVKGEPITQFCDRHKLGLEDRLSLFSQVCEAIQHAHLKGIVHRDLKPSNVLAFMSEGEGAKLKVIDFGVAKAMSQSLTEKTIFTETGQMIGTPEYMSPEQADPTSADIDTRSDIYSLGVLLYELIAGATPFDGRELRSKAYGEIQRILREVDPPSPSARLSTISTKDADASSRIESVRGVRIRELAKTLRSELEWIPLKAMRKEPQHRYQTAMSLAEDVRNYLEGRPLEAGPESTGYRVRKYVRRHKALVTGVAAVAAALVAGLSVATWQWRVAVANAAEAERQREVADAQRARADERAVAAERAEREEKERAEQLQKVSDFQADMLGEIDATMAGVLLMADVRARFGASLEKAGVPAEERAARLDVLRHELAQVNATDAAAAMIDRTILRPAIASIDERFEDDPSTDASLRKALAHLYSAIGLYDEALPLQESALATRRRVLGDEHQDTLASIASLGWLFVNQGRFVEAEASLREALEKSRRALGEEATLTLASLGMLGWPLLYQGRFAEAEPYFREALEKRRRVLGAEALETVRAINNMGFFLKSQGRFAEADPYLREAVEKSRRVLGAEHSDTLTYVDNLGHVLINQGRFAEAEPYLRENLETRRRVLGEEHPETLRSIESLGYLLNSQGRFSEAEPYFREVLERRRQVLGEEHPSTLVSIGALGFVLASQNDFAEAEPYLREAIERFGRAPGEFLWGRPLQLERLADVLIRQGRQSEAEPYLREALESYRRLLGEEHPDTVRCLESMAWLQKSQGDLAEAEASLREATEVRRRVWGEEDPATIGSLNALGALLSEQGKFDEAESYLREAVELSRRVMGSEHRSYLLSLKVLGDLLIRQGRQSEAEPYLREALETSRRVLGDEDRDTLFCIESMAWVQQSQGRFAEAEPYLLEVIERRRRVLGEANPDTARSIKTLGAVLSSIGRNEDVIALLAPFEPAGRSVWAETNPTEFADLLRMLGGARVGLGYDAERFALAESNLLEAHELALAVRGQAHDQTRGCAESLVVLYTVWDAAESGQGHDAKAAVWRARLNAGGQASP